jgi:hypothetical protein
VPILRPAETRFKGCFHPNDIAKMLGVSRATVYRYLARDSVA